MLSFATHQGMRDLRVHFGCRGLSHSLTRKFLRLCLACRRLTNSFMGTLPSCKTLKQRRQILFHTPQIQGLRSPLHFLW